MNHLTNLQPGALFGFDPDSMVPSFSKRGLADMNVPDEIRKSVLFLGLKSNGRFVPKATAFIVAMEEHGVRGQYLVTAQHVVSGLLGKGDVWLRMNRDDGGVFEAPIWPNIWHYHPNEPRESDVAACLVNFWPGADVHAIPLNGHKVQVATKDTMKSLDMGLGDEVVIVGLFTSHFGADHNIPIIRIGNIAAIQEEPIITTYCGYMDAHLIEARSIGGLSGSPVFVILPAVRYVKQETNVPGWHLRKSAFTSGQGMFLLGLVHGHFDADSIDGDVLAEDGAKSERSINTGIGVVVPVEKILETLNEPEWAAERKKQIDEYFKRKGAISDLSNPSGDGDDNEHHKENFMSLLNAAAKTKPQGDQT